MKEELLTEIDYAIKRALNHQNELITEAKEAQIRAEIVGNYRVKFMDLKDKVESILNKEKKDG